MHPNRYVWNLRWPLRFIQFGILLALFLAPAPLRAQQSEEIDQYKVRVLGPVVGMEFTF